MQTLDAMPEDKQLKISSETLYIYAPLAHRIGLYNIKTELEDLSFKYTEPIDLDQLKTRLRKVRKNKVHTLNLFKNHKKCFS